jgi:hypothetical protein
MAGSIEGCVETIGTARRLSSLARPDLEDETMEFILSILGSVEVEERPAT